MKGGRLFINLLCFGLLLSDIATGQYSLWTTKVTNSASYARSGAGDFGIAQGSIFVVFGYGLGPSELVKATTFPLPKVLAGTSVHLTVGSFSDDVPLLYTLDRQVAALLPSTVPAGTGTYTVSYGGTTSYPDTIVVVPSAFGIYTVLSDGMGDGVITAADYSLATRNQPVKPGDPVILWGTGLGPVQGDEGSQPLPGNRFPDTQVWVGNQQAAVEYAGRSGCCAGVDQVVFRVPAGVEGCMVPVSVRAGSIMSNFVSMPVSSSGPCSDEIGFPTAVTDAVRSGQPVSLATLALGPIPLLNGLGFHFDRVLASQLSTALGRRVGAGDIERFRVAVRKGKTADTSALLANYAKATKSPKETIRAVRRLLSLYEDQGIAGDFSQVSRAQSVVEAFLWVLPPPGTCTTLSLSQLSERPFVYWPNWLDATATPLDAGPDLTLNSPLGMRVLNEVAKGQYLCTLGSGYSGGRVPAGDYSLSGKGGHDIGAFSATLGVQDPLVWMNKYDSDAIDRSQPLIVRWSGGGSSPYVAFGGWSGSSYAGGAGFLCTERTDKKELTVPTHVLSVLPPTGTVQGYVFLGAHPLSHRFSASGADFGVFLDFGTEYRQMAFN